MSRIELGVTAHRPERVGSVPRPRHQFVDVSGGRGVSLEQHRVPEQRDRMDVQDPVVLGADDGGDGG